MSLSASSTQPTTKTKTTLTTTTTTTTTTTFIEEEDSSLNQKGKEKDDEWCPLFMSSDMENIGQSQTLFIAGALIDASFRSNKKRKRMEIDDHTLNDSYGSSSDKSNTKNDEKVESSSRIKNKKLKCIGMGELELYLNFTKFK